MRLLVLGGFGMLGHRLVRDLGGQFTVVATVRENDPHLMGKPPFQDLAEVVGGVDATDIQTVAHALDTVGPDVVINCIGIVKQADAAADPIASIQVNSLFPHRLVTLCRARQCRLIHISTDCVFSGARGPSSEADNPDPVDLYGRSKLIGEVRTRRAHRPNIHDRPRAAWRTGTARVVHVPAWRLGQRLHPGHLLRPHHPRPRPCSYRVVSDQPALEGLMHVASEPITKFDLLTRINDAMSLGAEIHPVNDPTIDRTLDGSRFAAATAIRPPSWDKMIEELANDPTPSNQWRTQMGPLEGKRVLITGGTGSLGKVLVRRLLGGAAGDPAKIIVFSRDEAKQHVMRVEYHESARRHRRDHLPQLPAEAGVPHRRRTGLRTRVAAVLRDVDVVFNAAALKQVPTCEYFPSEAVQTNIARPGKHRPRHPRAPSAGRDGHGHLHRQGLQAGQRHGHDQGHPGAHLHPGQPGLPGHPLRLRALRQRAGLARLGDPAVPRADRHGGR